MIVYNEQAAKRYNEEGLVKCEFCGRSFFEERVEGHKKICSKENPFKPLKKNELEENIREIRSKSVSKAEVIFLKNLNFFLFILIEKKEIHERRHITCFL